LASGELDDKDYQYEVTVSAETLHLNIVALVRIALVRIALVRNECIPFRRVTGWLSP
jgi:hypothetical protein